MTSAYLLCGQDLPAAIWGCLTNPTFLFISLAGGTDGAVMAGVSTFMPKFIQQQFGVPASKAGFFTGQKSPAACQKKWGDGINVALRR